MALSGISQIFKTCIAETKQSSMAIIVKFKEFRNNPEFFQKVCQVAFASLQLVMYYFSTAVYLNRLSSVFLAANMHDFYGFLKQPYQWFFPVNVGTINDYAILDSLKEVLKDQLSYQLSGMGIEDPDIVADIAELCLKAQLLEMNKHLDGYRDAADFKKVLLTRLQSKEFQKILIEKNIDGLNFSQVSLDKLKVVLRHTPLLEKITKVLWGIADIGCITLFLQEWNLVDTSKWVQNLGASVTGLVSGLFALQVIEATRKLTDEALTPQQKRNAIWDIITSTAESALWGATYLSQTGRLKISPPYLFSAAIFAKGLGLVKIAAQPPLERVIFQRPTVVIAAAA